jgi:hypothetical protein
MAYRRFFLSVKYGSHSTDIMKTSMGYTEYTCLVPSPRVQARKGCYPRSEIPRCKRSTTHMLGGGYHNFSFQQVLYTPDLQPFAQEQRVSDFSWKLPGTASRCGMDHGLFLPHCHDGGSQRVIFNCPSALPFIRLLQIWHANSLFPSCQVVSEAWYEYYHAIYR